MFSLLQQGVCILAQWVALSSLWRCSGVCAALGVVYKAEAASAQYAKPNTDDC